MSRLLTLTVLVVFSGVVGCGTGATQRDTTLVDVTATVTGPDGRPLSKALVVILQPQGDTLAAKLEATTDGTFTGKAAPGRYIYYVKAAKGDAPPKGFSAKATEPNEGNTVEVSAGRQLDIKLTN